MDGSQDQKRPVIFARDEEELHELAERVMAGELPADTRVYLRTGDDAFRSTPYDWEDDWEFPD